MLIFNLFTTEEIGWMLCGLAGGACINLGIKCVKMILLFVKESIELEKQ